MFSFLLFFALHFIGLSKKQPLVGLPEFVGSWLLHYWDADMGLLWNSYKNIMWLIVHLNLEIFWQMPSVAELDGGGVESMPFYKKSWSRWKSGPQPKLTAYEKKYK
jgi:hypothetical protein